MQQLFQQMRPEFLNRIDDIIVFHSLSENEIFEIVKLQINLVRMKLKEQGIFDSEIIGELIEKHLSSKTDTSWMLWNLIVFQNWYQNYFL